jgi:hypothetical protein
MALSKKVLEKILLLILQREGDSAVTEDNLSGDIQKEDHDENDFSVSTLLGVALIGAVSSAAFYYIYTQLSKETKKSLKDMVIGSIKHQVVTLTCKE